MSLTKPQGISSSKYPLINELVINVLERNFKSISDIEYSLCPATKIDQCFEELLSGQSFMNESKIQKPKNGGRFQIPISGSHDATRGTRWGKEASESYRNVPFSVNLTRDMYKNFKSSSPEEIRFNMIMEKSGDPATMRDLFSKYLAPKLQKLYTGMHKEFTSTIVRQYKEGSGMIWDVSAKKGQLAHANPPKLPVKITLQMLQDFQMDVNELGIDAGKLRAILHPSQYSEAIQRPLTHDMKMNSTKFTDDVYAHFGFDKKMSEETAPPEYEYGGITYRRYGQIKTFTPCRGVLTPVKTNQVKFKFVTRPELVDNEAGIYYRAVLKLMNPAGTTENNPVALAPGDVIAYVGNNPYGAVSRYGKKELLPRFRTSFSITSLEWMSANGGYPGSYSTLADGSPKDLTDKSYENQCSYDFYETGHEELMVSFKSVHTYNASNPGANTANRDLDLANDEFHLLADETIDVGATAPYDPNYFGIPAAFFYHTDSFIDLNIANFINNPIATNSKNFLDQGIKSLMNKNQVFLGNSMKPQLRITTSDIQMGGANTVQYGLDSFAYVDTLGDQFNYIIPTKPMIESNDPFVRDGSSSTQVSFSGMSEEIATAVSSTVSKTIPTVVLTTLEAHKKSATNELTKIIEANNANLVKMLEENKKDRETAEKRSKQDREAIEKQSKQDREAMVSVLSKVFDDKKKLK